MIHILTDFGALGPYQGDMLAVCRRQAPGVRAIDMMADLPRFNPRAAAYLLAAFGSRFQTGDVVLAVVDPGVGTQQREPVWIEADGRHFVGPHNGLFQLVLRRAAQARVNRIDWRPDFLSNTFHGRDLFAPVAASLARGERPSASELRWTDPGHEAWPDDLAEIVYIDAYGNAMTGVRASAGSAGSGLHVAGHTCPRRATFGDTDAGRVFCFENAYGLLEIALNRGDAANELGLMVGSPVAPL